MALSDQTPTEGGFSVVNRVIHKNMEMPLLSASVMLGMPETQAELKSTGPKPWEVDAEKRRELVAVLEPIKELHVNGVLGEKSAAVSRPRKRDGGEGKKKERKNQEKFAPTVSGVTASSATSMVATTRSAGSGTRPTQNT